MPYVNLIQEQRLQARKLDRQARAGFLSLMAVLVGGVAGYGFLAFQADQLRQEESRMRADLQRIEPLRKEIEATQAAFRELQPREEQLVKAREVSDRWTRILAHLSVNTPDLMWMTGLRSLASDPEKPIQVTFSGLGNEQERIAEFILRLQNQRDLENVNLRFTQEKPIGEVRALEFEVAADLIGSAEKKKKTEEAPTS